MRVEAAIAFRYIRNRRSVQFSGLIAALAWLGITIGVAAVICVASIFLGFRQLFEDLMLRIDPHVRITGQAGKYIASGDSLRQHLRRTHNALVVGVLDGKAIAMHGRAMHVLSVRGYEDSLLPRLDGLRGIVLVGDVPRRQGEVVLGAGAAERLGALPGDTIELVSPEYIHFAVSGLGIPASLRVRVVGILLSNDRTYDNTLAVTTQSTAAELFATSPMSLTALDIFCSSRRQGAELVQQLRRQLDARYRVESWHDLHREMYAVMEWERVASFLLLSLIVLLAVFNIVAMLMMTVSSKQRDIAVLRTLGAQPRSIGRVFQLQGVMIALGGTLLGAAIGIGLCLGQQRFHWIMLDTDRYIMQELPVALDWGAAVAVSAIGIVAAMVASLPPARRAMRTPIAESLRFE